MSAARSAAGAGAWTWGDSPAPGIGLLVFDLPGRDVNVLNEAGLADLDRRLDEARDRRLKALVLMSGKPGNFCAGADVDLIRSVSTAAEGTAKAAAGQRVFARLADMGFPTVAAIHGACVGGGAEMATWCTSRVLSDDDRTRFGFPEVRLGIVPGFGGTQLAAKLVGLKSAIELVTTGRSLTSRQARAMGFADAVVPRERLLAEAVAQATCDHVRPRRGKWQNLPLVRDVITAVSKRAIAKVSGGHYPAPAEAVRLLRLSLDVGREVGLDEEARALGALLAGDFAQNLLHVFELHRERERGGTEPREGALLGVIGAGIMGAGIAGVALSKGYRARLRDLNADALGRGLTIAGDIARRAMRHSSRRVAGQAAADRLSGTIPLNGFRDADLIVEAVVELVDVKGAVLRECEAASSDATLIATNTSSLSVEALSSFLAKPERFVGLHFFNPVPKMPLVEVIRCKSTDEATLARALGWSKALGKTPIVVGDSPGFLVNRLLMPYLAEALELQREGVSIEAIDSAAKRFGMPMGPFRVLDEVGLDIAQHVERTFTTAFPDRFVAAPLLARLVGAGRLGKKSGGGFYEKRGRSWKPWSELGAPRVTLAERDIQDRLFLRMADEALRCLETKVAASAGDVDVATIFGMGFPPFRGGLAKWIETSGPERLHAKMKELESSHGQRYRPSDAFARLARGETRLR